ncbi:MAG TPA: hypothetical protein VGM51_06365 [Armatimonadota bacterium]|jgi:hypothetical protein
MRILAACVLSFAAVSAACGGDKPFSFGRFGFSNSDGLLTMNVSPNGVSVPNGITASWRTRRVERVLTVGAAQKTILLAPTPDGPGWLRYTLLYPGMEARFGVRARITFSENKAFGASVNGAAVESPSDGWIAMKTADIVVMEDEGSVPAILTFSPMPKRVRFLRDTVIQRTLEAECDSPMIVRVTVPSLERRTLTDSAAVKRFIGLVDTHQPIARLVKETFRLDRSAGAVSITDTYTPANARIALPPMLAFAASHQYPMKPIAPGRLFCKYGPLVFGGKDGTLTYSLPVPPVVERGYLAPAKQDPLTPLLNEVCGHWPAAWNRNGVDLGYAGVTNAAMAWNLLTHDNKLKARDAWTAHLDAAFTLPPYKSDTPLKRWKSMTEPFSSRSFLWGYSIDNKTRQCDIEWGIGLPLYGLYKYGTTTGDWARVRRHWPASKRLAGYFDLADDYAWMTVCNAEDGYSTGTGDALNAGYAGMAAMLDIARKLGDREAEEKYAYRLARMALLTAMRPAYTKWGRAHGMVEANEAALGFWENSSFTTASFAGDPWGVTTLLSGDGCMPEILCLYATTQPTAWKRYLDEYARFYPDWYDATRKYEAEVTYNGNSGYVTFPHLFARAWFGAGQEELREWVAAAAPNRNNAWVGPNAIAEIITQQAPMVLTDWGRAPIPGGSYGANSAIVRVNSPEAFTLRSALRRDVTSVKIDGHSMNFTEVDTPTGAELPVPLTKGRHIVKITFGY